MKKFLVEIKARSAQHDRQRRRLLDAGADFRGTDHQIDRYFTVPEGRLKLRSGTVENTLIAYRRPDRAGPKDSAVTLTKFPTGIPDGLEATLAAALPTLVTVDKQREIYFIDNVKFHLDTVAGLGTFIEIEAIGESAEQRQALRRQCDHYIAYLGVRSDDLIDASYSDLLLSR